MMANNRTTINRDEYIGKKFNRLTIQSFAKTRRYGSYVNCRCDCGAEKEIRLIHLTRQIIASCGCASREAATKHGMHKTAENSIWRIMRQRCNDKKCKEYPRYGGRGIKVCEEWNDFAVFYADMGPRPEGMTLERINNDGDYCKENCRWATKTEQARNRRNNVLIDINGAIKTVAEWCETYAIGRKTVYERLRRGWDGVSALTIPAGFNRTLE